jgi:hypothetical protein
MKYFLLRHPHGKQATLFFSKNLGREPFTGVGIKREIIKIHVM